jgi:endonuclease-8
LPLDLDGIRTRARARGGDVPLGELLLDQQVVSGIGNIWRCEALFAEGVNPWSPRSAITDERFDALLATAARLMTRSATGAFADRPVAQVYKRNGRPCRRCGTLIEARRQGEQARIAFWCPTCQPGVAR